MVSTRRVYLTLTLDEARAVKLALEMTYTPTWPDQSGLSSVIKLKHALALAEDFRPKLHGPRFVERSKHLSKGQPKAP